MSIQCTVRIHNTLQRRRRRRRRRRKMRKKFHKVHLYKITTEKKKEWRKDREKLTHRRSGLPSLPLRTLRPWSTIHTLWRVQTVTWIRSPVWFNKILVTCVSHLYHEQPCAWCTTNHRKIKTERSTTCHETNKIYFQQQPSTAEKFYFNGWWTASAVFTMYVHTTLIPSYVIIQECRS